MIAIVESMLYQYAKHIVQNMVVHMHGNFGLCKLMSHIKLVATTLRCKLNKSINYISHKFWVLAFGKKVVSKILSST